MKITCITDACSYIYLHQFQIQSVTLYDLLSTVATIRFSQEVYNEIARHTANTPGLNLLRHNRVYHYAKNSLEYYDDALFEGKLRFTSSDKGESENFIALLDAFLDGKGELIFLSDDLKAIGGDGHLRKLLDSFPICRTWTTFEVILYLYLKLNKKKFTYEIAETAIRDINSFIFSGRRKQLIDKKQSLSANEFSMRSNELSQEAQDKLAKALKKLSTVKNIT